MRRTRFALALLVAALALPQAAGAKELGPIRVVAESGKVGWIRGAAATAWWAELYNSDPHARPPTGACQCDSPASVAKFEQHFFGRARWPLHDDGSWPTGMLLIQSGHRAAWLYYPASRTTPPYIVAPGGLASGAGDGQRLTWDSWKVVTPPMQRLIEAALKNGTVRTASRPASFPTGWVAAGVLGALLLLVLLRPYTTKLTSLRGTTIVLRGSPPSK